MFCLSLCLAACLQTTSLFLIPITVIEKAEVILNLDCIFVVATWSCIFLVPAILKRFTGSISSTIFELFICNYLGTSASLCSIPTDNNKNNLKSKQLNYYSLEIHSRTACPFPHPPTPSSIHHHFIYKKWVASDLCRTKFSLIDISPPVSQRKVNIIKSKITLRPDFSRSRFLSALTCHASVARPC